MRSQVVITAAALTILGCDTPRGPAVTAVSRDSAGITIVENSRPNVSLLDRWHFVEPPTVVLGVDEGNPAQQFANVVGAARLSDGRIVIADGQSKEVRYFDQAGAHLLTVGGPGEGPGEFRLLMRLDRLPGDTIMAGGWPLGWAARFDPQGRYVGNTRLGPFFPSLLGHFMPDGSFLMDVYSRGGYGNEIEWFAANGEGGVFRPTGHIVRITTDGDTTRTDTLRTVVGEEWFRAGQTRQNLAMRQIPFARNTVVAWTDNRLYVGETGSAQLEVRRYDGTLERLIRWEGDSVRVTANDRADFRDVVIRDLTARGRQNRLVAFERWLAAVPYPDVKPVFNDLATDPSGRIWVRAWSPAGAERDKWTIFAPDGKIIAGLEVPLGLEFLDVGEDYVLALWKDEVDLEYVRLYRLEKPPAT